jgi:hypothetical protein
MTLTPDQLHQLLARIRAKRLQANKIIGQELRAYYQTCTTEEPPPKLLVLLKKLDEEIEPSAEQVVAAPGVLPA